MDLKFFKGNDLIKISDLISVRSSYTDYDLDLNGISSRYALELTETDNRVFFLAKSVKDLALAYVQLILVNADDDPELANGVDIAHIHDLRVRSDLQGHGVGKSLMNFLEGDARSRGIKMLTLGVDNWNTRAMSFYELLGYQKFKESPGRTDDEACFLMRKYI